jgi:hypothetical protein
VRPLGHDDAREGRDADIDLSDTRLRDAWTEYLRICPVEVNTHIWYDTPDCGIAKNLLAPIRPSLTSLHHLIIEAYDAGLIEYAGSSKVPHYYFFYHGLLGNFISAGYSFLQERTIEYPLHTPNLHYLGKSIEKDLIITGSAGNNVGERMRGTLTNYGDLGYWAGRGMAGVFVNHGTTGSFAGDHMVGRMINDGIVGSGACNHMCGEVINSGTMNPKSAFHESKARFENHGKTTWRGFPRISLFASPSTRRRIREERERFLDDAMNPQNLSPTDLWDKLHDDCARRNA